MNYIPYGRQDITQSDLDIVMETLQSDWITQGPMVQKFEKKLADYTGAKYVSAMNSATSALHVACLSLGVSEGDYVWTTPITFVASANCALYCGAKVDFVDINEKTYNLDPNKLKEKLEVAKKENRLPKVVIPVHLTGQSCEMDKIKELSDEYGFRIIEDASHAIGGKYKGQLIGNCRYSDISIFSFHPVKIVTTGEGGACLTNDPVLFDKINLYRSHGITRSEDLMLADSHGPWYYEQVELGFNYRITDIQAALGYSQLDRLDSYISKRHEIASAYNTLLSAINVGLPYQHPDTYNSYHLYVIQVDPSRKKEIFCKLRESNIGVNLHYIPIHLQPYYKKIGFKEGDFPVAEAYYKKSLSIPMFPKITYSEIEYVALKLKDFLL
jgi:UDP-4-amino-4,6-dideoxy-N-acetyl-beta-L-altrosamine transaminase